MQDLGNCMPNTLNVHTGFGDRDLFYKVKENLKTNPKNPFKLMFTRPSVSSMYKGKKIRIKE